MFVDVKVGHDVEPLDVSAVQKLLKPAFGELFFQQRADKGYALVRVRLMFDS
jgi:hypothetical protein